MTPRQEKVKENSSLLYSSLLSTSKAGVSLEWKEIPLGFPLSQEIPRGIPRMPQSLKMIQITPEIVQKIPRDSRSDPTKMWPRRFCATIPSKMPAHLAILRTNPDPNLVWQDNIIAIGPAPSPSKIYLPLG